MGMLMFFLHSAPLPLRIEDRETHLLLILSFLRSAKSTGVERLHHVLEGVDARPGRRAAHAVRVVILSPLYSADRPTSFDRFRYFPTIECRRHPSGCPLSRFTTTHGCTLRSRGPLPRQGWRCRGPKEISSKRLFALELLRVGSFVRSATPAFVSKLSGPGRHVKVVMRAS